MEVLMKCKLRVGFKRQTTLIVVCTKSLENQNQPTLTVLLRHFVLIWLVFVNNILFPCLNQTCN